MCFPGLLVFSGLGLSLGPKLSTPTLSPSLSPLPACAPPALAAAVRCVNDHHLFPSSPLHHLSTSISNLYKCSAPALFFSCPNATHRPSSPLAFLLFFSLYRVLPISTSHIPSHPIPTPTHAPAVRQTNDQDQRQLSSIVPIWAMYVTSSWFISSGGSTRSGCAWECGLSWLAARTYIIHSAHRATVERGRHTNVRTYERHTSAQNNKKQEQTQRRRAATAADRVTRSHDDSGTRPARAHARTHARIALHSVASLGRDGDAVWESVYAPTRRVTFLSQQRRRWESKRRGIE